jgi:hypothetical protein
MAGYIINPFSSDFNPTTSVSYSSEPIPIAAYGLIGITSLTLAYVTLISSVQGATESNVSATSMLPAVFSTPSSPSMAVSPFGPSPSPSPVPTSAQPAPSIPMAQAVPAQPSPTPAPQLLAKGGKTRHHKKPAPKQTKHKKTKRSHH